MKAALKTIVMTFMLWLVILTHYNIFISFAKYLNFGANLVVKMIDALISVTLERKLTHQKGNPCFIDKKRLILHKQIRLK